MTAKEYIYKTLDTWRTHKGDQNGYKMITSSDTQIAELMIAFAQEKVKEAVRAISIKRLPAIGQDIVYLEQFVNFVLREDYPINENIK